MGLLKKNGQGEGKLKRLGDTCQGQRGGEATGQEERGRREEAAGGSHPVGLPVP